MTEAQFGGYPIVFDGSGLTVCDCADLMVAVRIVGEDVNVHMVDRGLAWHYKRYEDEQAPGDRVAYSEAEAAARASRPVPPWDWRRR